MDKKALRRAIGEQKKRMGEDEIISRSAQLAKRFFEIPEYQRAKSIYAYLSFNQEVRTRPIIERAWAEGKRVAVPKVTGDEMIFIWISDFDHLSSQGAYNIPEPIENIPVADDPTALMLMPGLAFDLQGHRVGYGGGYYDRFLAAEPHHPLVALCYDFQLFEHLEVDFHDIPVHRVISDAPSELT